jgi:hypothetical protein
MKQAKPKLIIKQDGYVDKGLNDIWHEGFVEGAEQERQRILKIINEERHFCDADIRDCKVCQVLERLRKEMEQIQKKPEKPKKAKEVSRHVGYQSFRW